MFHLTNLIQLSLCFALGATIQVRGNYPWTVLLCKFKGVDYEPQNRNWFERWSTVKQDDQPSNQHAGSISEYFRLVSNELYTINGSNVFGWYNMPYSQEDIRRLSVINLLDTNQQTKTFAPVKSLDALRQYHSIKQLCIQTARSKGARLHANVITVVNSDSVAMFCRESGVLLTPKYLLTSAVAHEMVHSMSVGHSYSNQPIRIFPHAAQGEYDDKFDLMSTANAFMHRSNFGFTGPGLSGAHLDYLGWLPMNRIRYWFRNGKEMRSIRVASLSVPFKTTTDDVLVLIPYDRDNPQNVFSVELRTPVGLDRGIGQPGIIIRKIQLRQGNYFSTVIKQTALDYDLTNGTEWIQFLPRQEVSGQYQFIHVKVVAIYERFTIADLLIHSTFDPATCLSGEVSHDGLCWNVPSERHMLELVLGRFELTRRSTQTNVCSPSFESFSDGRNGTKCLTPNEFKQIHEKRLQQDRRQSFYNLPTYGQNQCITDFRWRTTDHYDYICVPKTRFSQISAENAVHNNSEVLTSSCNNGTLPRLAHSSDRVCVSQKSVQQVQLENQRRTWNLRHVGFFNGHDMVFNIKQ